MNQVKNLPKNFDLIQVFRGIAAIFVLLNHLTGTYVAKLDYNFLNGIFSPGWSGVNFFFCLSGFIMYYISYNKIGISGQAGVFLLKRIIRIYPMTILITLILVPVYFLNPSFGKGHERDFVVIVKSFLLLPTTNINPVAWTLSYEMFFYFVYSFIIRYGYRRTGPVIILWLMMSFFQLAGWVVFENELYKFIFSRYNVEFLLGGIAGYFVINRPTEKGLFIVLIGCVGYSALWYLDIKHILEGSGIEFGFAVASMFLIIGAGSLERTKKCESLKSYCF